ncbi:MULTISPECIES: hypothetical protein [Streptomyces]|uniref:hypothetical protein n=1 Tax=Streptomyces TaxID=1883 RepID=UPI0004D8F174|nr:MULTISPECIES: hypothetical protein [Streptomyces]
MTDARGVCKRRAENLSPAVPYVRGWAAASRGADALAEQLRALSLETDFPGLRADVNVTGDGVVQLGMVRPEAVQLLTCLLTAGLSVEIAQKLAVEEAGPPGANSSAA